MEKKCEACGLISSVSEYIKVRTTNGGLLLCRQCLDDINRKNPKNLDARELEIIDCLVSGWTKSGSGLYGGLSCQCVFDLLKKIGAEHPAKFEEYLMKLSNHEIPYMEFQEYLDENIQGRDCNKEGRPPNAV